MSNLEANAREDQVSLLSTMSTHPSPATTTKIIKRLRAMTLKLLPVMVPQETLNDPTSRVITPKVIAAYSQAAGDFPEALPYCLLRARQTFIYDANTNPADYDESMGRAIACEVLARRIVHKMGSDRLYAVMSGRMRFQEWDGDESTLSSALETAIDQHCTIFLSSDESQTVINSLWRGDWVQQQNDDHNDIEYVQYRPKREHFWDSIDPSRFCVPRYQNWFRILIWFFFLIVYSQAVQQPTEMTLEPRHPFDEWEWILYIMALAFTFEDTDKLYASIRFFGYRSLSFWHFVAAITDMMLLTAFVFRIVGIKIANDNQASQYKLQSFQVLSCVAPLIWLKIITVVDGFKYIGTMQICVARMLKESGIFFLLLAIVALGFAQGMYAIDAADGYTGHASTIINNLIQGLLGSPNFADVENAWGLWIFYCWNIFTTVILLNILISLFSQAYSDVQDDASAQFLAFFARKTIEMIRAPDEYVYPAPFNLIEIFLVAPTEWFVSKSFYRKYNRVVMSIIFFLPLFFISFLEARLDKTATNLVQRFYSDHIDEGEEEDPANQNPDCDHENGLQISKVPFDELTSVFPNSYQSMESSILGEIGLLAQRLDDLKRMLEEQRKA